MKRIVILSGAGMSAESGIRTFRDSGGLWEEHRVEDVATPGAWIKNPALVLEFYNQRRKQILEAQPNGAHLALAALEKDFDVQVITQNIDDLHERAGSTKVLHLHGEIRKSRSTKNPLLVLPIDGWELKIGDVCPLGSQLRPHIVWFGEQVPAMYEAVPLVEKADAVLVVGTSLEVYPAASLIEFIAPDAGRFLVDPAAGLKAQLNDFRIFKCGAVEGVPAVINELKELLHES